MKAAKKALLSLFAVVCMSVLLIGCSGLKAQEATTPSIPAAAENKTPAAETPATETPKETTSGTDSSTESAKALQNLVDQIQEQVPSMEKLFNDTMTLAVSSRGNSILYTYAFKVEVSAESFNQSMGASMDAQASTFESFAAMLKTEGISNPSVIIEVFSKDGSLIFTREYFPPKE